MMPSSYSGPSFGQNGYPVFVGGRRQVGGGLFGSLQRILTPSIRRIAKPLLKKVGSNMLELGANVAADALQGENVGESLKARAKQTALNTLSDLATTRSLPKRRRRKRNRIRQVGSGRVTKQKRRANTRRRRKKSTSSTRKTKRRTRKRKQTSKRGGNITKRRKVSYF